MADGFELIDLGIDVPIPPFVEAVEGHKPDVLATSALLTITAMEQRKVVEAPQEAGIRESVKIIIVGGGTSNDQPATGIGANGLNPTALGGAKLCSKLVGR